MNDRAIFEELRRPLTVLAVDDEPVVRRLAYRQGTGPRAS